MSNYKEYKLENFLENEIFEKQYLFKIHFLGYRHTKTPILDCMDIYLKSKNNFYIIKCDNGKGYHKMNIIETDDLGLHSFFSYAYDAEEIKLINVNYYIPKTDMYLKDIKCSNYPDATSLLTNIFTLYDFKNPSICFNYIFAKNIEMKKTTSKDFVSSIANDKELDFLLKKLEGNDKYTKQCIERNKKEKKDDKSR